MERIVLGKLVDEMKRVIAEAELYMDLMRARLAWMA